LKVQRENKDGAILPLVATDLPVVVGEAHDGEGAALGWRFKLWFRDSKVVLPSGQPRVVYHRTAANFDVFDTERGDLGAHFGTSRQAEALMGGAMRPGERTLAVYLSIQNPIRLQDKGGFHADAVAPQLRRLGILDRPTALRLARIGDIGTVSERRAANREIREHLRLAGFDGVVYRNTTEEGGDSYIIFDPCQVKSATANSGMYDWNDESICG
jgi:hypothetical protein